MRLRIILQNLLNLRCGCLNVRDVFELRRKPEPISPLRCQELQATGREMNYRLRFISLEFGCENPENVLEAGRQAGIPEEKLQEDIQAATSDSGI